MPRKGQKSSILWGAAATIHWYCLHEQDYDTQEVHEQFFLSIAELLQTVTPK